MTIRASRTGSLPHTAGLVDPQTVRINKWHGRLPTRGARVVSYARLKEKVAAARRNVAPVLLRPANGTDGLELVYGALRMQACLELGLPLFGVVMDLTETEVFETMILEGADGWSVFELGVSVKRAVDAGLYPSLRRLASACDLSLTRTALAHATASLPEYLLQYIGEPEVMTPRNARSLVAALAHDPEGVRARAAELTFDKRLSPRRTLSALLERT